MEYNLVATSLKDSLVSLCKLFTAILAANYEYYGCTKFI